MSAASLHLSPASAERRTVPDPRPGPGRCPSLLAGTLALALALPPPGAAGEARPESSLRAVVLELFTSQGCSSCPAADRVLSRLGGETRADGVTLVPLAYHVDYWNRIGWVDPFSSPRWSARQRRYADGFGLRSVYTPQIVLNGRVELVGSHESSLRAKIPAASATRPAGRVEILRAALDEPASELVVEVAAEIHKPGPASPMVANLAVFESGLVTRVASGENSGRTLENDYVVRLLRPLITLLPGGASSRSQSAAISLDPGWAVANLGVAAFLQDSQTLEIHAAAVLEQLGG